MVQTSVLKKFGAALLACLIACSVMFPFAALADETTDETTDESSQVTSVSTATVTASYSHPITGAIEDSGGESSSVLGQSMVEGATFPQALVEVDQDEVTWVSFRFKLADELSDITFAYDADGQGSNYQELTAEEVQQNTADNTVDYRVQAPGSDGVFRISLYVGAMGRSVVYFATLSDLVEGNSAEFVQSVEPGLTFNSVLEAQAAAEAEAAAAAADDTEAQSSDSAIPIFIGGAIVVIAAAVIVVVVLKKRKQN